MNKDGSVVFFIVSAIYVAPNVGEMAGNIIGIICLGIGWYCLWKEQK